MNAVGLWLVKTQTIGTAVANVTVTGAFSSTYDNYLVTLSGGTMSAAGAIHMRLGASNTGYYGFLIYGDATTNTVLGAGRNNLDYAYFVGGVQGANQSATVFTHVMNPGRAAYTRFVGGAYQNGNGYGTMQSEHRVATAFTDFLLQPEAGTFTGGTIRVYGYRN